MDAPGYLPIDPEGPLPPPPPGQSAFSYVCYNTQTGRYLARAEGQQVPGRTVSLPGMDAFLRQDAWAAVRITRNEQFVPSLPPTAQEFVYTTPSARCADPVLPSTDSRLPVDIAQLHSNNPWPLNSQLQSLLVALFANLPASPETELIVQLETVYEYRLTPALGTISLPVFLQPPAKLMAAGTGTVTNDMKERSTAWANTVQEWFRTGRPSGADGVLRFDLVVMSNLTKSQMPLVRLRNAMLAIKDIQPPLDVMLPTMPHSTSEISGLGYRTTTGPPEVSGRMGARKFIETATSSRRHRAAVAQVGLEQPRYRGARCPPI